MADRVEVLVACMHQVDDSLYKAMNLKTDAILASQGDSFIYKEYPEANSKIAKLIATNDVGVGRNRNKALSFATGDYLLCADEDMIYVDSYEEIVQNAFKRLPKADIIIFNLHYRNRYTKGRAPSKKIKRVHLWNSMRYGAARIAIRRASLDKVCLSFSRLYGGGAPFSAGEDSLFIREAFNKKLRIYYYPVIIADVKQETSSWFKGYNDKYFIDKGILLANMFPWAKHLFIFYFAFQLRKVSDQYSFWRIYKLMREGFRSFDNL